MGTQTQTFTTTGTFTAPANMLNTSVTLDVRGAAGGRGTGGAGIGGTGGKGARAQGSVTLAPGGTLKVKINYKPGDTGGKLTGGRGGTGGGSAAVLSSATVLLLEAGGGGGGGAGSSVAHGGAGGTGGANGVAGHAGTGSNAGTGGGGATGSTGGTAGGGKASGTAGTAASGGTGATWATSPYGGGGGAGGYAGGGGGGPGGTTTNASSAAGGGGASSFAAGTVSGATFTTGYQTGAATVIVTYVTADAPSKPTLLSPSNGSTTDMEAVDNLKFIYNPQTYSGAFAKWAYRAKIGTGAFKYWNATSNTWSTTVQWNAVALLTHVSGTEYEYTFPTGAFVTGDTYNWSVATSESHYTTKGTFATTFTAHNQTVTNVVITAPTGTVATSTPTVAWTGPATESGAQVKIFTEAQSLVPGFTPATSSTPVWNSGTIAGGTKAVSVPASNALSAGSYVACVKVTVAGTSSRWFTKSFTVGFDALVTPTLVVNASTTPTSKLPTILLSIATTDNLLSLNSSTFKTSIGTVAATVPADWTLTQTATWAAEGTQSLGVKCKVAAIPVLTWPAVPISGYVGQEVSLMATARAPSTARTWKLQAVFKKATGAVVSTVTLASAADTLAGVALAGHCVVPATSSTVTVQMTTTAAWAVTEHHQIDCVAVRPTTTSTWSIGGFVGNSTVQVQGTTETTGAWLTLGTLAVTGTRSMGTNPQQCHLTDLSAAHGKARSYRVRTSSTLSGVAVVSAWSTTVTAPVIGATKWWMLLPTNPATALALRRAQAMSSLYGMTGRPSIAFDRTVTSGFFQCFGRDTYVKAAGTVMNEEFDLTLDFLTTDEWNAFMKLWLANQRTGKVICLKSDMTGAVYYVNFGPTRPTPVLRSATRQTKPVRQCTIHCYPATPPA